MIAARWRLPSGATGLRGCGRDDLHQQAADAHPGKIGAGHFEAGEQAHQHPVKAILHRRARAAGRAQHRHATGVADQEQIAGIDRHAEMLDNTADVFKRRRNHVAPVGDRGGAEYDHEFGAEIEYLLDRGGQRGFFMRHPALGNDRGGGGRQPLGGDAQCLFHHLRRQPRQQGRNDADPLDPVGRDRHAAGLRRCHGRIAQAGFDPERHDLDGCDHLAGHHGLKCGQRREGDRLVDPVDVVDRVAIDHQHAGARRKQVGTSGEGALDVEPSPAMARAIPPAATSSETSPSSSRTTTISFTPALLSVSTSAAPMVVPFFSTSAPCRRV